jgi:energy-coupling factor transporter ATP-binding protein EcfA2
MNPGENPFVGLRPFEAEDALYYFGRRDQTQALLNCLRENRFLAVVGSSGSGKSSLVRAGLIPNLEAGFMARNRDAWHIARMKPGDRPVDNLAQALHHALDPGDAPTSGSHWFEAIRTKGIHGALANIRPVLEQEKSNLFLLVDQFEEVFRFGVHAKETGKQEQTAEFVDLLLRLAEQEEVPVYVCLTMRSDYIGDCDAFPGLPEAMNRGQYLVPRLNRTQRQEAIEGPIRLSAASISSRL